MNKIKEYLDSRTGRDFFAALYRKEDFEHQRERYEKLYGEFEERFGGNGDAPSPLFLVNVPGRVEIGGNHTDHNRGKVVAGSVSLDAVAMCTPVSDGSITIWDTAYNEEIKADAGNLERNPEEEGSALALVKGVAEGLKIKGYRIGGFRTVLNNEVMSGSGLSSSAVFEVIIGSIFNALYNGGDADYAEIAEAAQYAENVYFGKPCGLMDQMACAAGGMVFMDFKDKDSALVKPVLFDFDESGYSVIVVKSGGDHAELTDQYASIPAEMMNAASVFGKEVLRGVGINDLIAESSEIRSRFGDRAFLRALHFLQENGRVDDELRALENGDMESFLEIVSESGDSSWRLLQNVVPAGDPGSQDMAVALAVTDLFVNRKGRGACRVHGGGFAGTILAFIHTGDADEYIDMIEKFAGKGSAVALKIRGKGAFAVSL